MDPNVKLIIIIFRKDKYLLRFCERFLKSRPSFKNTTMSIFYNGKHYSWNGLKDLFEFPLINIIQKIRFIFVTVLLSSSLLKNNFLDRQSLSSGMLKLYGKNCFKFIWDPIIKGKFGEKSHDIPLRWMSGRLKQRLESRVNGKESLGFIPGSIKLLTNKVEKYILESKSSFILKSTEVDSLNIDHQKGLITLGLKSINNLRKNLTVEKVIFTTPTSVANNLKIKNLKEKLLWSNQNYFRAYCVLIELKQSLSDYYWTNINDKEIFFCGYIEQTNLTGIEEYGGIHIAYLTKYIYVKDEKLLSKKQLIEHTYNTLYKLFPKSDVNYFNNKSTRFDIKFCSNS